MSERFCPRCEHVLSSGAEESSLFCPFCGAPQVRVSQQLLQEAEEARQAFSERAATRASGSGAQAEAAPQWQAALRIAALAGAVAAGLALLAALLPPVSLLLPLWAVGAPVVALGMYATRHRDLALSAAFGARLGFLSGLAVALALATVNTVTLLLARFVFGRSGPLDGQLAAMFAQVRSASEAQYGSVAAKPLATMIAVPEFRAGLLLFSIGMFIAGYLLLATLGGAFAGMLRARALRPSKA